MKRRASALVYVIIVVFSITSVVLVTARLASASNAEFDQQYATAQFNGMVDGAVAEAKADAYKGTLTVGSRTSVFASRSASITVSKPSTLARSFQLDITATINGRPFRATKIIGNRAKPNPAFYGIWATNAYAEGTLGTTLDGSAYFASTCTLTAPWAVTDDILATGTSTLNAGSTVSGTFLSPVRAQTMPTATASNYTSIGTALGNSATDITFGAESGGYYPVFSKASGNMTLSGGVISGKGTVFVNGNLTISGSYNYADSNSRAVIIVGGRLTVNAGVSQIVGTYIVSNQIAVNSAALTIPRGNLCTGNALNRSSATLNLTQDRAFLESADECVKHRLPGYFP